MAEPIFVTRPSLPPLADFLPMLEEIWRSRILSNRGPFHQRLESALGPYASGAGCSLTANGMLALEAAIAAANLAGEVVTTPYSFVATSHAIARAGLTPVFADIEAGGFNIDPDAVEAAITPATSAILAVHCYGHPCDHAKLRAIADKHGLVLIYDAAHAFGVEQDGQPILGRGDFEAVSFHATKAFNTFEGGLAIATQSGGKQAIDLWLNFGIASETDIPVVGTNGKMSEFNAAFGLLQLDQFEDVRAARETVDRRYRERLAEVDGINVPPIRKGERSNYSYFPVLVGDDFPLDRDELHETLKTQGIFSRRYFWPLLSTLGAYAGRPSADPANLRNATRVASQILCLPIYPGLEEASQERIVAAVGKYVTA